jgi:hypothetical protein
MASRSLSSASVCDIVFAKSLIPARIRENFDIVDFELSGEEVAMSSALSRDQRTGPDPDTFGGRRRSCRGPAAAVPGAHRARA